jgi:arylsulfatase A-like enzyme
MLKQYLKVAGIALVFVVQFSCKQQAEIKQPNIVFVFADQFRSMEMGCYGGTGVATPNFDKLAAEGVRFTNAISTSPICSPYRAMMLTGNYPVKNGMVTNDHFMKNPTPYFAEACKTAGYKTGYIGKWHIDGYDRTGYIPKERRHGFDFWRTLECTHSYNASIYYHQDETEPRTWEGYDAVSQTEEACNYIKENSGQEPFCLFLSWGPPHGPYYAPKKYMDQIDVDKIELRKNVDDFAAAEKLYRECDTYLSDGYQKNRGIRLPFMLDKSNEQLRQWYHGYYASIAAIDDLFGDIYKTLEETGQLENTIVVFTSDHGDNLGSHRQHEKDLPYEESISIPFIIRYPEKIEAGLETDALLAPIDVMPTILSLANVACPEVDGLDMSASAKGEDGNLRDAVLLMKTLWMGSVYTTSGVGPWRGLRTKRYTYARNSHTMEPWMLFDNEKDPYQYNNLVDEPEYSELVKKLDKRTTELLVEAGDPEDPNFFMKRIHEERIKHGFGTKDGLVPTFVEPGSSFEKFVNPK